MPQILDKKILLVVALVSLGATYWYIFNVTPTEAYQGFVQKIMYIHVPSVLMSYIFYFVAFFCSVGVLWKKSETYDIIALSCIEVSTLMTGICLVTGAIWGKPTWNTYWTWDAKLTITLITFIIYCGYSLFRAFSEFNEKQMLSAAILGIFGFIAIPLNHLSVTWWRTLHQPSTFLAKNDPISPELRTPLYYSLFALFLLILWMILKRIEMEKAKRAYMKEIHQNLGGD